LQIALQNRSQSILPFLPYSIVKEHAH